tara:strand:+ start:48 stop:569 length:522 start_codon:yes stop_codon:yes gene_type:complete
VKNFSLFVIIITFFYLNSSIAEEKIVFIDMDRVISTSNPGSSILDQLKLLSENNSILLKKEEKVFKEKEKKLISQKNILSESDFQNNVNKLKIEINDFNLKRNKMIKDFNKLKIDNTNKLLRLINPILLKFSNDKAISFILQKKDLVIGKTELDITDEIIKIINTEIEKFKLK